MSRYTVQGEYLCEYVDHCTCGVGRGGYYGAHEPGCGLEPVGPIEQLLEAQPVAHAPDAAVVLAGLVQEMRARAEQYDVQGTANTDLVAFGIARAINIVEAAQQRQATSGARAAGEPPARVWWSDELGWIWGFDGRYEADDWSSRWQIAELPSDAVELTAAPPAPGAPGVAGLLAECARRQEFAPDTGISCDEIMRLLAPSGADGTEAGT